MSQKRARRSGVAPDPEKLSAYAPREQDTGIPRVGFSSLPQEIRDMIWKFASDRFVAPRPRESDRERFTQKLLHNLLPGVPRGCHSPSFRVGYRR